MTTAPLHVNPEIAELFDEIRRDPDSSLFRFEHRRRRGLGEERDVMVRPSATGLSAAERELFRIELREWFFSLSSRKFWLVWFFLWRWGVVAGGLGACF